MVLVNVCLPEKSSRNLSPSKSGLFFTQGWACYGSKSGWNVAKGKQSRANKVVTVFLYFVTATMLPCKSISSLLPRKNLFNADIIAKDFLKHAYNWKQKSKTHPRLIHIYAYYKRDVWEEVIKTCHLKPCYYIHIQSWLKFNNKRQNDHIPIFLYCQHGKCNLLIEAETGGIFFC